MNNIVELKQKSKPEVKTKIKLSDEQIDALIDLINEAIERTEDHERSEDGSVAEYVAGVGYGGESMHEVWDSINRERHDDRYKALKLLLTLPGLSKRDQVDTVVAVTELKYINGIHRVDGEVLSMTIGEISVCLDSDEIKAIADLSEVDDESLEKINRRVDGHVGKYGCTTSLDYERFSLVIDDEKLNEKLSEALGFNVKVWGQT